jgi:hypothetical protein
MRVSGGTLASTTVTGANPLERVSVPGGRHETRVGGCEGQSQIRPSMDSDVVSGGRRLESPHC